MTKEEKQLLLKDLCARLPYHPRINVCNDSWEGCQIGEFDTNLYSHHIDAFVCDRIEVLPYLRPISSMMQGEWEEMTALIYPHGRVNRNPDNKNELLLWLSAEGNEMPIILMNNVFSWLNEHHFDHRGLIPMGLALEAPEGMYKN